MQGFNRMQLLALFLGAALFAATSNPPAPLDNNDWFTSKFTELVRTETRAPKATIEIAERSLWHYDSMGYWQVVRFRFYAHSPVTDQDVNTAGVVLFVYNPASHVAELMSPAVAGIAVKVGREKQEPSPSPSA
jgi:hypothetical protein